jgi:UDP-N-acetylglucosamine--N-acetylmuramyl-(pentapeptide) pyrophosphoryl-undecaprenol N-acetylglucosamine transferase
MKVILSGGHLTPALAVIDYAKKHHPSDEFVFAGRLYSQPSLKQRSWEEQEVTKRSVPFVAFDAPKLDGSAIWKTPLVAVQMLRSIWRAYQLIGKHQPDVFLSFGGFLALPLAVAARLRGIPVVTHEQTRAVGVANLWVSKFAQKVAVSFPETQKFLSAAKTTVTGNPLRAQLLEDPKHPPEWIPAILPDKPLLYITGGNQGSQCINVLVQEGLPELLKEWWVIHQCGSPTTVMNYKKSLEKARTKLPTELQHHYFIREWVTETELSWIYQHADGALSRSGANTVTEFMTVGLPAVFIPLPQAHQDEQLLNAEAMADTQAALILVQKEASVQTLVETLSSLRRKLKHMTRQAKLLQETLPTDPTAKLYQLLESV